MVNDLQSIIDDTGHERFLGNLVPLTALMESWPTYGDTAQTPMVPRSRWKEFCDPSNELHPFLPPVHDQDGIGMCNASAACAALEFRRALQGLPAVKLSGGDLYGRINGGQDRGSLLEDGMRALMRDGVASVEVISYLDWRSRKATAADRGRYKVLEAFICPTFDHCMSAVIAGFSLVSGIMWHSNYTPGADGWLPRPAGRAGGHAVMGYAPACRGNEFGIWHLNSWGTGWGRNGRVVFPEASYTGPVGGWWAIRSVVDEGGVIPLPK